MRTWLVLLAPLLIWAVHFMGVYGIASAAAVIARPDEPAALLATGALTLACAVADLGLLLAARRRPTADETERFVATLTALGALFSMVAVLWQGLPALIGH